MSARRPLLSRLTLMGALILLFTLLGLAPARADLAKATAHFEKGTRLYSVGEYDEALKEFKAGYIEEADPSFVYNVAQCYRQLGQQSQALFSYRRFLSLAPDTPLRPDVERKVEELDGELRRQRQAEAAKVAASKSPSAADGSLQLSGRAGADQGSSRWPAWLAGVLTVGFAGGATALTVHTNRRYNDLRDGCGSNGGCTDRQIDDIRTRGLLVNGLWALTAASALATGIAIYATGDEAGATVAFRF